MAIFSNLGKYKNTALLIIRIGLGVMFILHGYPKLLGGPEKWEALGSATKHIGITFYPVFWGFMAAAAETFGGFLVLMGLAFRPATILLTITMIIASIMHFKTGDGISGASHALESAVIFMGLTLIGPGRYSVDKK